MCLKETPHPWSHAGTVVRKAREAEGISIRELARRAGVSAAQISRIEAGTVEKPEMETLIALARGLVKDPQLLLIVAGRVQDDVAREHLRMWLEEPFGEIAHGTGERLEDIRARVTPNATQADLADVAGRAFVSYRLPLLVQSLDPWLDIPQAGELEEIVRIWIFLPESRRQKLLEHGRDQAALASLSKPEVA